MTDWVTGPAILDHVGNTTPTAADTAWAATAAAAVSAGITRELGWSAEYVPPAEAAAELTAAATTAGVEAYKRREAPFGVTGYVDLQGGAIRVARDWLDAIDPILNRHRTLVGRFG